MKILYFIESLRSGGKERRLVELIKGLSSDPNFEAEIEVVLTKDDIHYKDILSTKIKIHYIIRGRLKKDPSIFFKFYKIAKKFRPDIIHVWGNLVAIYAIPAKVILRIPMVNNQITGAPLKMSGGILSHKLSFPFSDRIVANSFAGLKAYNAPRNKSLVIYNGFDFNRNLELKDESFIRNRFNIKTKFVVAMVASFSNKKDYETYIKAANKVIEKVSNVTFLCIGSGDTTNYELMVENNSIDKIYFLGKQDNVESIMNICDIGVLTTYTEGISNALLEFMSLKKPIVVTGEGGCIELIEHNVNGYLFGIGSVNELNESIIKLLSSQELLKNFGDQSCQIVKDKFNITQMLTKFKELYLELI